MKALKNKNVKIGIEVIRSGFQFTLCYKSIQELIHLWNNGLILDYDRKITKNMNTFFKLQAGFDIFDFAYAYLNNKKDYTALLHHALITFLCLYYQHKNQLAEGVMINAAMSNQITGLGFNALKIFKLTSYDKRYKKIYTFTCFVILFSQLFYRIPLLGHIYAYSVKYTKDTNKINKVVFFILLQLYNEYDWIKWSSNMVKLKGNKFVNNKTLFLISLLFSYISSKKFYKKLENYY